MVLCFAARSDDDYDFEEEASGMGRESLIEKMRYRPSVAFEDEDEEYEGKPVSRADLYSASQTKEGMHAEDDEDDVLSESDTGEVLQDYDSSDSGSGEEIEETNLDLELQQQWTQFVKLDQKCYSFLVHLTRIQK